MAVKAVALIEAAGNHLSHHHIPQQVRLGRRSLRPGTNVAADRVLNRTLMPVIDPEVFHHLRGGTEVTRLKVSK